MSWNEDKTRDIIFPKEWSEAVNSIVYDPTSSLLPIAFICGPKNSGKTTFSRLLLNDLLQRYTYFVFIYILQIPLLLFDFENN